MPLAICSSGLKSAIGARPPSHPARHARPPLRSMARESRIVLLPARSGTAAIFPAPAMRWERSGPSTSARTAPSSRSAEGELFSRFFPSGEFVFENLDQTAYSLTGFVVLGIGANIMGAAETALPQTFVMTFADLATQQPLGPLGHFDPVTGAGSVIVPNLAPGTYPVVATCVRPTLDVDLLEAGIRRNGAFLQSIGAPPDLNSPELEEFVKEFLGTEEADLFAFRR